jgi:hypothetical protein
MNNLIQRIERLLSALAGSPKEDRKQAILIWEQFRREAAESTPAADEIIDAIDWMIMRREWRFGEPLLVMASRNLDPKVARKICSLIELAEPTAPIENSIELLAETRLSDSVPTLIRAVGFRFDFDPTLQIPTKALQALCEIGSQEALDYLRHVSTTEHGLLGEKASELLQNRERGSQ